MIRARALELLARREHSATELADKLRLRGFEPALVTLVIGALQAEGLQNDARFTETYVHHRVLRGYGPVRIRQELQARGISADLAEAALASAGTDWTERLAEVWSRKFGKRAPANYPEQAKQSRFLHQRGFSSEQIHRLMRQLEKGG